MTILLSVVILGVFYFGAEVYKQNLNEHKSNAKVSDVISDSNSAKEEKLPRTVAGEMDSRQITPSEPASLQAGSLPSGAIKKVQSTTPAARSEGKVLPTPPTSGPLRINDAKATVADRTVVITWNTSVEARSSVILDGQNFDSVEGIATRHSVSIKDLTKGSTYNYQIVAKSLGQSPSEDKVSQTFKTPTTYTILLDLYDDNCYKFIITDSSEYLVRSYNLSIEGTTVDGMFPEASYVSDSNGEIKYCKRATKFKITGRDISLVSATTKSPFYLGYRTYENLTKGRLDEYGTYVARFSVVRF